jgi:hypothetical protein
VPSLTATALGASAQLTSYTASDTISAFTISSSAHILEIDSSDSVSSDEREKRLASGVNSNGSCSSSNPGARTGITNIRFEIA